MSFSLQLVNSSTLKALTVDLSTSLVTKWCNRMENKEHRPDTDHFKLCLDAALTLTSADSLLTEAGLDTKRIRTTFVDLAPYVPCSEAYAAANSSPPPTKLLSFPTHSKVLPLLQPLSWKRSRVDTRHSSGNWHCVNTALGCHGQL